MLKAKPLESQNTQHQFNDEVFFMFHQSNGMKNLLFIISYVFTDCGSIYFILLLVFFYFYSTSRREKVGKHNERRISTC